MTMDQKTKRKYNLRNRNQQKRKIISDNDGSSSSDEDYVPSVNDDGDMDDVAFKKFLYKMFPSKNLKTRIKEMDAITEKMDKEEKANSDVQKKIKPKSIVKKEEKETKKAYTSEDESDYDDEYDDDDYEDYDDEENAVINIVLNITDMIEDEEEDEDEYDSETESESSSDSENEQNPKNKKKIAPRITDYKTERSLLEKIEKGFDYIDKKDKKNSHVFSELQKFTKEQRKIVEKEDKKANRKARLKNMKEFRSLINERKTNNEVAYFSKLEVCEQEAILHKIREANKHTKMIKPYRFKLIDMDLPDEVKAIGMKKMSTFQKMEPDSSEYFKMKKWIDAFMSIPFNTYKNFGLSLKSDGPDKCREFMTKTLNTMDEAVYGLNDAKMQIMQMIGTWISNPHAVGNAIAIKGPPGTGKTTLVKEGVSKVLNRPFAFIALGGSTDSSFLEGHGYTYEGSTWGKIVSILMESKCMNPVIYFDELDKVSDTPKGEEIIGILTHLIDTSQNSEFHDKYFSDIKFDLSKCLFIFSYNDESKINPILKDRMYKIETKGYNAKEKGIIAKRHLIPGIQKQIGFNEKDVVIPDDVISYLIQTHTGEEKGVRNLKRCLEMVFTKLNLSRFTDTSLEIFKSAIVENIEFPYTITNRDVDKLVVKTEQNPYLTTLYT